MDKLEIESLMEIKNGRQYEILLRLRELNQEAYFFMKRFGKRWKQKYHEMWKTSFWKEAKELLREYYTIENGLVCFICNKKIEGNFTLHHEDQFYNSLNLFSPNFIKLIHNECHNRYHKKK